MPSYSLFIIKFSWQIVITSGKMTWGFVVDLYNELLMVEEVTMTFTDLLFNSYQNC